MLKRAGRGAGTDAASRTDGHIAACELVRDAATRPRLASQTHESQRRSVGKTMARTRRRHCREPSRDFSRRLFSYRVRRRGSLIRPGRIPIHFPESTDHFLLQVRDVSCPAAGVIRDRPYAKRMSGGRSSARGETQRRLKLGSDQRIKVEFARLGSLGAKRPKGLRRAHRPRHPTTADAVAAVVASQQAS